MILDPIVLRVSKWWHSFHFKGKCPFKQRFNSYNIFESITKTLETASLANSVCSKCSEETILFFIWTAKFYLSVKLVFLPHSKYCCTCSLTQIGWIISHCEDKRCNAYFSTPSIFCSPFFLLKLKTVQPWTKKWNKNPMFLRLITCHTLISD